VSDLEAEVTQANTDDEIEIHYDDKGLSLMKLIKNWLGTTKAISEIPAELFELTERELMKEPDDVHRRLKISFWNEFSAAQRQKSEYMTLQNVIHGVCSYSYWKNKVVTNPTLLAWLITPPAHQTLVWQELIQLGENKLRRALKIQLVEKRFWKDKTGEVHVEKRANVALIKEVRSIVEMLQNRLHGTVVQRQEIQSKSLHVNVNQNQKDVAQDKPMSADEQMGEIDKMLKRIEKVAAAMPELPEAEVESESDLVMKKEKRKKFVETEATYEE